MTEFTDDAAVPLVDSLASDDFPWPPRDSESTVEAFAKTWKQSVFHPTSFFARMPRHDHYGAMIGYYLVISVFAAGFQLFWRSVLPPFPLGPFAEAVRQTSGSMNDVVGFLLSPLVALAVLYIGAGILHLFLLIVRGAKYEFETTTRVVAFAHGPALFTFVPYVGAVIGGFWTIVLAIIGLREAHQTSTGKAAAAVLVPLFLLIGLMVLVALAAMTLGVLGRGAALRI